MKLVMITLFLILLSVVGILTEVIDHSILNIEELNSIHYRIKIGSNPVLKHQEWKSETVTITNKHGQEYICELPKIEFPEDENKKDESIFDQLVNISELLKPMEAAPCIIKRKDWWTYEFCYGSLIKQYHLEDNRVIGTILVLGKFESEYNWKNSSETKNKLQKFHSQFYVNGTRCDITGEPRRTEVRFHCEEGSGDYILQVDEPESCRYIVTIATTRVCHHPYLKNSFTKSPHGITCAPALNEDQLEKYQRLHSSKLKSKEQMHRLGSDSTEDPQSRENLSEEDEGKWNIRILTLPISKKEKLSEDTIAPEQLELENLHEDAITTDSVQKVNSKANDDSTENVENLDIEKIYEPIDNIKDNELRSLMVELLRVYEHNDVDHLDSSVTPHMPYVRDKIYKLFDKWIDMQTTEYSMKVIQTIQQSIDDNFSELQQLGIKIDANDFANYFDEIELMVDRSLDILEKLDIKDDQPKKIIDDVNFLTHAIMKAFKNLLKRATSQSFNRVEELTKTLEKHIHEKKKSVFKMLKLARSRDPNDEKEDLLEKLDTGFDGDTTDDDQESSTVNDQTNVETSHVRILNERNLEESQKTKLEKSIKDRLQNSENFGRKIEVKILTPNYLDSEEKDSFTDEESEAFHNVLINILSAGAEEMNERERQNNLESNYNFKIGDILAEDDDLSVANSNTEQFSSTENEDSTKKQ